MTRSVSPPWPHTVAILAGGNSKRMNAPKHDLRGPDGRTMAEVALACARATARRVIVSGSEQALPDLEHVPDRRNDAGPLGGIESVLQGGGAERYLFIPCDMPRLESSLLRRLADGLNDAEAAVFDQGEGNVRPVLPLALRCSTADQIQQVMDQGTRSIHGLLASLDTAVISLSGSEHECLININTPGDWSDYLASTA